MSTATAEWSRDHALVHDGHLIPLHNGVVWKQHWRNLLSLPLHLHAGADEEASDPVTCAESVM